MTVKIFFETFYDFWILLYHFPGDMSQGFVLLLRLKLTEICY